MHEQSEGDCVLQLQVTCDFYAQGEVICDAASAWYEAMVKFAKQLELQLVPEWRGAYCRYKLLKKILNIIKQNPLDVPDGPGLSSNSESPLDRGQSRRKSFWSHIDLIEVT